MRSLVSFMLLVLMWAAVAGALALVAYGHVVFGLLTVIVVCALGVSV